MSGLLPAVEIEPSAPARHAVIWLHGLGADGHDFEPIVPELGLDRALAVRFVFPHAPKIPVTINMGLIMPAWYDVRALDLRRDQDERGILRSVEQVRALIGREIERGVPAERIVLAGFSQGGAIALHVGLRYERRLAGLLVLSTYLLFEDRLERERGEANRKTPIFQAHGEHDPMVPHDRGVATHRKLVELGYEAEFRSYPMQHQVCLEEIREVGAWLRARFDGAQGGG